jgi:hypothetical protein
MDPAGSTMAARIRLAATLPIQQCLLSEDWFNIGMGVLHVVRGVSRARVMVGSFLLDTAALGVKDAYFREFDGEAFETFVGVSGMTDPFTPVEPAYARKLLRELVAWSRTQGFRPHANFAVAEGIFGTVQAYDSDAEFAFGIDGRTTLIPGPTDTFESLQARWEPPTQHAPAGGRRLIARVTRGCPWPAGMRGGQRDVHLSAAKVAEGAHVTARSAAREACASGV